MTHQQKPLQQRRAEALARIVHQNQQQRRRGIVADLTIFGWVCLSGVLIALALFGLAILCGAA